MSPPLLADFAARLAAGAVLTLLVVPWREVPPRFFRIHCVVAMALLVLSGLDYWRTGAGAWPIASASVGAFAAYLGSAAWGLGLPRLALPISTIAGLCGLSASISGIDPAGVFLVALDLGSRLASAALLGTTLSAMLLGHYYLTAPAMSIEPLRRLVGLMAGSLAIRAGLAGTGLVLLSYDWGGSSSGGSGLALFLGMRWGMGLLGPALATWMAWKTAAIRSTQSATGILYVGMTLVLVGELAGLILQDGAGIAL